ncbi:MAG: hypothetical protein KDI90_01835 [Alphaproteobacteria bacterium]|nr:hypothetical protein [Alphaproteobacteria bacterium]
MPGISARGILVRAMRILLAAMVLMFGFSTPAAAGGPADGELFGYKLGEVYAPNQSSFIDGDMFVPESLNRDASDSGIDEIEISVMPDSFLASSVSASRFFDKWDEAKLYADEISRSFQSDFGGNILLNPLDLEEIPLDPAHPRLLPAHDIYFGQIENKYSLTVTLWQTQWDGRLPEVRVALYFDYQVLDE